MLILYIKQVCVQNKAESDLRKKEICDQFYHTECKPLKLNKAKLLSIKLYQIQTDKRIINSIKDIWEKYKNKQEKPQTEQ